MNRLLYCGNIIPFVTATRSIQCINSVKYSSNIWNSVKTLKAPVANQQKFGGVSWKGFSTIPATVNGPSSANTLAKDVIVFKYDNPKFFRMLNIFAFFQFFFWMHLTHFSFSSLRDVPATENENASWWQRINLGENRYRYGIAVCCFLVGYGVLSLAWMYTLRSVRFLILRKGGEEVSLCTYGPFGRNRITNVPLKYICADESRESARHYLPLRVKNKSFFYILDMKGQFTNKQLYDFTVGLKRKY